MSIERPQFNKLANEVVPEAPVESVREERNSRVEQGNKNELSEVVEKLRGLEEKIEFHKGNFIRKILNFREINKLQQELGILKSEKDLLEENINREAELNSAYVIIVAEELEKAKLEEKEAARLEKEDNEARDVKNLARKFNSYFVHDIVTADWKPSENNKAVDTRQLSFGDQIDIVTGLRPTVSASSLRPDTGDWTFTRGGFGALIKGGKILGGETSDIGSHALGLRNRDISENHKSIKSIERAINRPVSEVEIVDADYGKKDKKSAGYNELVIENPEVAGIYLKWYFKDLPPEELIGEITLQNELDERGNLKAGYDRIWDGVKAVYDRKIPLLILTLDNKVRYIDDIDFEKRSFRVSAAWNPKQIITESYDEHLNEERRKEMVRRQIKKVTHLLSDEEKKMYEIPEDAQL